MYLMTKLVIEYFAGMFTAVERRLQDIIILTTFEHWVVLPLLGTIKFYDVQKENSYTNVWIFDVPYPAQFSNIQSRNLAQ